LRLVAINALIVSGLAGLAFGLLVLTDNQKAEYLLILAFIQGLALSFDLPVRMALVPNLVERRDLSSAIALNTTTFHAGMFVGPALFGVIFSFFGLAAVFIVNGLTFFWFMGMLLLLRLEPVPKRGADTQTLFADMAEGVIYRFAPFHAGTFSVCGGPAPVYSALHGMDAGFFRRSIRPWRRRTCQSV